MSLAGKVYTLDVMPRAGAVRARVPVHLLLIACVAIVIRIYRIGDQSLWTDELFSRYYTDLFGLKFLWTTGMVGENSPPLYYMAIAGWMKIFGTSEAAMRSLSLVASVLTLPLVYLLGRELFDQKCAQLAALIFALSPMQVGFAQEARTYALLLIPFSLALLAIAHFLRSDTRQRVLWLYAGGAICSLYCHATAAFFIAACNIVVVGAILSDARVDRRARLTRWLAINVVVALVAMPELIAMVLQAQNGTGLQWIPPLRPADVVRALSPVVIGPATPHRFPGVELSFLLVAALAGALLIARPQRRAAVVLIAIPAIFVVLIAGVSMFQPIFITRVFCWLGIPFALLLAHGLGGASRFRFVLGVVAATGCVTGLYYQFANPIKEPWREMFEQTKPELSNADHVVLAPMTDPTAFRYYAPELARLEIWQSGPLDNVENDDLPLRMGAQRISRDRLVQEIRSGANVWMVLRYPDLPYVNTLLPDVPAPRLRSQYFCGQMACIAALSWPAH